MKTNLRRIKLGEDQTFDLKSELTENLIRQISFMILKLIVKLFQSQVYIFI